MLDKDGKIKILVLGPPSTGKTSICNYLGDSAENVPGDYRPTKGVRIVEFMVEGLHTGHKTSEKTEVELWDCSGDVMYENCWPALGHKVDGIIFVYNENGSDQKNALAKMYDYFVKGCGFHHENCIVFYHPFDEFEGSAGGNVNGGSPLQGLTHVTVDLRKTDHELRKTFSTFLRDLFK